MVDLKISEIQKPGNFRFHSLKVDLRAHDKAEVLKCFSQLGFYVTSTTSILECDEFLFVQDNGRVTSCENAINSDGYKWVSLVQLEEMVILDRNDALDANHIDQDGWKWFVSQTGVGYVFGAGNAEQIQRWDELSLDHVELTPISKATNETTPAKTRQFLDPTRAYMHITLTEHEVKENLQGNGNWIEIPEGAHLYFMEWFYKLENSIWYAWMGQSKWTETEYHFNTDYANVHWICAGLELPKPSEITKQSASSEVFELNNFKFVDGVEAVEAVRDGFNVEYETDEGGWESFNFETGFKVGCLLGQPNRHNKVVRFRIVPKTLKIVGVDGNTYEFPTPIRHYPPVGTTCFIASLSDPGARLPQQTTFSGNEITKMWVDHRRLHLTAEAALAHIEAEVCALGGNF